MQQIVLDYKQGQGGTSLILDFNHFFHSEVMPLFNLVKSSGAMCPMDIFFYFKIFKLCYVHFLFILFCYRQLPHLRRVGGVFMKHAPRLKELYLEYCSNHPRAVAIVQNKRFV